MLRIRGGQRTQQHRVNLGKDRCIGADAERKREDDDSGKARRSAQHAQRVTKVLLGLLDPKQRPLIAMGLLRLLYAAVCALRRDLRFFRRHAATLKVFREQSEMRCDLARKFLLRAVVAEETAESGDESDASEPWLLFLRKKLFDNADHLPPARGLFIERFQSPPW